MKNNKETLVNDSLHELDNSLGGLLINIESLKALDTIMGHVRVDVDNTDQSDLTSLGLTMRDISHKIVLIDDLLKYALKDVIKHYEDCQHIKTGLFLEFIEKENTPNSIKNQG